MTAGHHQAQFLFRILTFFSQGGAFEEPEEGLGKGSLFWYQLKKPSGGIGKQNGAGSGSTVANRCSVSETFGGVCWEHFGPSHSG